MELLIDRLDSPVGEILIATAGDRLLFLEFIRDEARMMAALRRRAGDRPLVERSDPLGLTSRLAAYFAGRLDALDDVKVEGGGTQFQELVWRALRDIPVGSTISYGELALRIGRPTASRAVGMANSLNPIAIVVPCHRVIGAGGALTGYAGGLDRKRWLLHHEGVRVGGAVLELFEEK